MTSVAPRIKKNQAVEEYLEEGIFHDKGKDPDSEEFMGYAKALECLQHDDPSQALRCLEEDISVLERWINETESGDQSDEEVALWVSKSDELNRLKKLHKSLLS